MVEKDKKQLVQRTQLYLLLYAIALAVVSFILVVYWDILRREAGYVSILGAHRSYRRISPGGLLVLLPALPVLGLFVSVRSPKTRWYQSKWLRVLAVHILPLCLLGIVGGLFYAQYQQLQKEIAIQQEWKKNQEEFQDIRRKIEEQKLQKIPDDLPSILPQEE